MTEAQKACVHRASLRWPMYSFVNKDLARFLEPFITFSAAGIASGWCTQTQIISEDFAFSFIWQD